jgi:hypothetical protein
MKKEERLNVKTEDETLRAMFILIKDKGRGSVIRAIETSFAFLLDPNTLRERGASFSSHYLSPSHRERILKGESIISIANEISKAKEAPDSPSKTFVPREDLPSLGEGDKKKDGEKKEKKKHERPKYLDSK